MRFGHLYQDVVLRPLAEQLLSAVGVGAKAGNVLDVLADGGTLTRALVSTVSFDVEAGVAAVDISPIDAELAQLAARHSVKVESCGRRTLPFDDASFDAAFNLVTIGWSDRAQMIDEMRRVTKPGGVIAVLEYGETGATHEQILTEAYAEATTRFAPYNRYLFSRVVPRRMRSDTVRDILRFHGPDHFLDVMMQGRNMAANLSSTEIDALRRAVAARLRPYAAADATILMPIDVLIRTEQR